MQNITSIIYQLFIRNKKNIVEGSWPLVSNIIGLIFQILTIKIITNFISTDNYGNASLAIGILMLLNTLIIGPLMVAHNRLYFDYVKKSMVDWYQKYFKVLILKGVLIVTFLYLLIAVIYYLGGNSLYITYFIPIFFLGLVTPYFSEKTNYIEAERQQKKLAIVNNLQKFIYPLLVIVLIIFSINQITSIILAQAISILAVILIFQSSFKVAKTARLETIEQNKNIKTLRKEIFSFGWYLPLGYFLMWLLTTSDRYILDHFRSSNEVGIYAINYGLWSMPFLIVNGWLEVWMRPHIYDKASRNDWGKLKSIIFRRLVIGSVASIILILIIFIFSDLICYLLLEHNYIVEKKVILLIAAAHFFQLLGYSVLPMFLAIKKLKTNLIAIFSAALVNIMLNIYLIPNYGILGAAFSTFVGYIIWVIILSIGAIKLKNVLITNYKLDEDNKN